MSLIFDYASNDVKSRTILYQGYKKNQTNRSINLNTMNSSSLFWIFWLETSVNSKPYVSVKN